MKKYKQNRKLVWTIRYIVSVIFFALLEYAFLWIEGSKYAVNKQPWVIAIIVTFVVFLGVMLTLTMFMRQEYFKKKVDERANTVKCSWMTYNAKSLNSAPTPNEQAENNNTKR